MLISISAGNSGIGYETSLQLALHGARVYIAGRSPERLKTSIEQMKASSEKPLDLHMLEMDLQSLRSVKDGAEMFVKQESRLDILVNNAGVRDSLLVSNSSFQHKIIQHTDSSHLLSQIMAVPFKLTTDGFETQWQTNHLAHFLLTKTLLPLLEATAAASDSKTRVRVVNVSADAAILPPAPKQLDLAKPNLEYVTGTLSGWYGHPLPTHVSE